MSSRNNRPKDFALTLLGKSHQVRRKVFDRSDFLDPFFEGGKMDRAQAKKSRALSPLSEFEFDLNREQTLKVFHNFAEAIDTGLLLVSKPGSTTMIRVSDLQKAAQQAAPNKKPSAAFDAYAKSAFGQSYSDLIKRSRDVVIKQFKAAFRENLYVHSMDAAEMKSHERHSFSHSPVWAEPAVIRTYETLANQGHIYSQYLAGLLLATNAGEYDESCIDYLLMAYSNKHPEAMQVLSEYLLYKSDYYGSLQCALLSVDGGNDFSKNIVKRILGECLNQLIQTERGYVPLSDGLFHAVKEGGFEYILRKYFGEFFEPVRTGAMS